MATYNRKGSTWSYTPPRRERSSRKRRTAAAAAAINWTDSGKVLKGSSGRRMMQILEEKIKLHGLGTAAVDHPAGPVINTLTALNMGAVKDMGENYSFEDQVPDPNMAYEDSWPAVNKAFEDNWPEEGIDNPNITDPDIKLSKGQEVTISDKFPSPKDPIYNMDEDISVQQEIAIDVNQNSAITGVPAISAVQEVCETAAGCMVSRALPGNTTSLDKLVLLNDTYKYGVI